MRRGALNPDAIGLEGAGIGGDWKRCGLTLAPRWMRLRFPGEIQFGRSRERSLWSSARLWLVCRWPSITPATSADSPLTAGCVIINYLSAFAACRISIKYCRFRQRTFRSCSLHFVCPSFSSNFPRGIYILVHHGASRSLAGGA